MTIIQIAVIALVATFLSLLLKQYKPEYSMMVQLSAGALILLFLLGSIQPILEVLREFTESTKLNLDYFSIIIKALGICLVTQFACETCRDAGENALASKIEFAGKILMVVLSMPLIQALFQLALRLIRIK